MKTPAKSLFVHAYSCTVRTKLGAGEKKKQQQSSTPFTLIKVEVKTKEHHVIHIYLLFTFMLIQVHINNTIHER